MHRREMILATTVKVDVRSPAEWNRLGLAQLWEKAPQRSPATTPTGQNNCPFPVCDHLPSPSGISPSPATPIGRDFPDGLMPATIVGLSNDSITIPEISKHFPGLREWI